MKAINVQILQLSTNRNCHHPCTRTLKHEHANKYVLDVSIFNRYVCTTQMHTYILCVVVVGDFVALLVPQGYMTLR